MSNTEIIDALLDAGLIQFGAFEQGDMQAPYWLRLDMLPSYPKALKLAAEATAALIAPMKPDRIICTQDSQVIAALVSQLLGVPLIIHSGIIGNPVKNLIGAYDIGHPTALISLDTSYPEDFVSRLADDAKSVGLDLDFWVSLIETQPQNKLRHLAAVNLREMAKRLVDQGELSEAMAARISG